MRKSSKKTFMRKPSKQTIHPPKDGWKQETFYIVEVAFSDVNVVHKAIFYTGFLNGKDNGPGGYNYLTCPSYENNYDISDVFYIKAVEELFEGKDKLLTGSFKTAREILKDEEIDPDTTFF